MSGDQNQNNNNQNQNKGNNQQKGGNQKDGISISQAWSAANPGDIPAQMKVAFINGMAYSLVPLAGGILAKLFDVVGQKFFHVKPKTNLPSVNIMNELHQAVNSSPEDAKRAIMSVSKRLGLTVGTVEQVSAQVVEVSKPAPAPKPTDTVPSPAAMAVPHVTSKTAESAPKQQQPAQKGGKK